jgi:pimeloyl-ACP methyl ester carboxylesterase
VERLYAYLHGFGSGPLSRKGQHLRRVFADRGIPFELPDLNQPSFKDLSPNACLGAIEAMDRPYRKTEQRWCFVGSSFGGWLAARWAELNPTRVDKLVLLCPGFDLVSRWPVLLGPDEHAKWGREGAYPMRDGSGQLVPVHYGFYVEALGQPRWPEVPCPTLILHGTRDVVVPVDHSRSYAAARQHVELIELDDGHDLVDTLPRITSEILGYFDLV